MALTQVSTNGVKDGSLLNADINASAAIAGSKLNPVGLSSVSIGTTTAGEGTADDLTISTTGHTGITIRSGTSSEGNIFFADGTSGNARFRGMVRYFHDNDALAFNTAATERMRLDSSGRLLLGTTTAGHADLDDLTIATSGNTGITIRSGTSNFGILGFADGTSGNTQYRGVIQYSHSSDFMQFNTADAERMRIHSNGAVSIANTRSYYGALNVEAGVITSDSSAIDIKASGTNKQILSFGDHNTISGELRLTNSSHVGLGTSSDHPFTFYTGTGRTERMRIASNGNALFHTTTNDNTIAGAGGIQLSDDANGSFIRISKKNTQAVPAIEFHNPNGRVGQIIPSGTSTSYSTSSDYRLKENATAISDGITRLKTLKPYKFNFKSDASKTLDGFFAHEVTAVPEAITGTKDQVDSDNKPVYQGIDQSKLVPLLVAAVQELITKVETLEAA